MRCLPIATLTGTGRGVGLRLPAFFMIAAGRGSSDPVQANLQKRQVDRFGVAALRRLKK